MFQKLKKKMGEKTEDAESALKRKAKKKAEEKVCK